MVLKPEKQAVKAMRGHAVLAAVIAVAVVAAGFCVWYNLRKPTKLPDEQAGVVGISFLPSVKGCAETGQGMAAKTRSLNSEQEPEIRVEGSTIAYSRAISHLCCRKAELEKEVEGFSVSVYENWSGLGCKCMCFSQISASLENLSAGDYEVSVYERSVEPGGNGEPMEERLIISKKVTVR